MMRGALKPALVMSPDMSGVQFTYGVWVTGNPVALDANADVSPPAANRILTVDRGAQGALAVNSGFISLIAIGGTSITTRVWRYEPLTAKWWPSSSSNRTITLASTNIGTAGSAVDGIINGSRWFVQIVSIVGTVTALGYRAI